MQATAVQKICRVALTVSHIERATAFYMRALGFMPIANITLSGLAYDQLFNLPDATVRIVTLRLGDEHIALMQFLNHPGQPIPVDSRSNDLWFQHLAIVVSDLEHAYAHLRPFISDAISEGPQTIPASNPQAADIQAFKFKDLDGHDLELISYPPDKGQDKWHQATEQFFLGIDHSAIAIADTEQSLWFYRDLLGMTVSGGSFNQGKTQARLDGLPAAQVCITALRPVQGGMGIELLDYQVPPSKRPIPQSWRCDDMAYVQVEAVVPDLAQTVTQLRHYNVPVVSSQVVTFSDACTPYRRGCIVKDPNGHAVLLVEA